MPSKIVFFFNQTSAGWSETYYSNSDSPKQLLQSFTATFLKNSAAFRHINTQLVAIRGTKITGARQTYLMRPYPAVWGQRGSGGVIGAEGPDVASTDAVCLLNGVISARRRVYFRGLSDNDVTRNEFGADILSTALSNGIGLFIKGLNQYQLCIQKTLRPPDGGLTWLTVPILSTDPTNPARTRFIIKNDTGIIHANDFVVFNNVASGFLPRFPRMPQIIKVEVVGGVNNYYISYAMPGGALFEPTNMLVTQQLNVYDIIDGLDWAFERYSEHKTGRPFGSLRGRSKASTLRR